MYALTILTTLISLTLTTSLPTTINPQSSNITISLFASLEELSRIVDISYCVGTSGIFHPFICASRCDDFPSFELVDTFNTGPLLSDSCGYIVLDHSQKKRLIVAFRGTYSIANTIVDLSTVPQEYVPYPGDPTNNTTVLKEEKTKGGKKVLNWIQGFGTKVGKVADESEDDHEGGKEKIKCNNCTVHSGFWTSWQNTRTVIIPHLKEMRAKYPDYSLHLVGHSLGGAVAALAGLEFDALGWEPIITTFGEPKVGNAGLRTFIDQRFELPQGSATSPGISGGFGGRYRRVTHVDDPVPLLPLQEWGYRPHAGEVYISKSALQPAISDIQLCHGDEDLNCISGAEDGPESWKILAEFLHSSPSETTMQEEDMVNDYGTGHEKRWGLPIPSRYKMWQLFFAHRDYFWRLGLCVAGGDPFDWGRDKYKFPGSEEEQMPELKV